jgi:hypothetical protein
MGFNSKYKTSNTMSTHIKPMVSERKGAQVPIDGKRFGRLVVLRYIGEGKRLCRCDCGNEKIVLTGSLVNGDTVSCGCARSERARLCGAQHNSWKGGRRIRKDGYIGVWVDGKEVQEHRLVMEQKLGRKLLDKENVHHKNGQREDNRIENLELWSSSQPSGQRVENKTEWAIEWLKQYKPEVLK